MKCENFGNPPDDNYSCTEKSLLDEATALVKVLACTAQVESSVISFNSLDERRAETEDITITPKNEVLL